MASKAEVKEYTKEEIAQLTDQQLEDFAQHLEWRGASGYGYTSRKNLKQYQTTGFPRSYANRTISSRREFLITRLKMSNQAKWNPGIKELVEARKKEEERKEALKPKVNIKTDVSVIIELKDKRPRGHTFIIKRQGREITATQKQNTNATAGSRVCTAKGQYTAIDFENAIDLIAGISVPDTVKKGNSSLHVSVTLGGSYDLSLERGNDDTIMISQNNGRSYYSDNEKWHFNIADLREVIAATKRNYRYEVIEEKKDEKKTDD